MIIAIVFISALIALVCIAGVLSMMKERPPDDAHAIRLAADLGGTPPVLEDRVWSFEVDLEEPFRVCVLEYGVRVRRPLRTPIGEPARILAEPLTGRGQEDYYAFRIIVPAENGELVLGGRPDERLEGWETRVNTSLVRELARLEGRALEVKTGALELWAEGERDAPWVREVARFLWEAERTLRGESAG